METNKQNFKMKNETRRNVMKKNNIKPLRFGALCAISVMSLATWAHAGVPTGYFRADHADVFMESASEGGVPVSYALLLRGDSKVASVYRIEELDDGTESWVRLHQLSSGVIGADEDDTASFSGQMVQDGGKDSSKQKLVLSPLGQEHDRIEAKQDKGMSWVSLPATASAVRFGVNDGNKVFVSETELTGDFTIGKQSYHGSFAIDPVIPGIGALRAEAPDSESASGRSLQRTISALIAVVSHQSTFGSGSRLELIQIGGDNNGGDPSASLENK
jgi:hypothetical protein